MVEPAKPAAECSTGDGRSASAPLSGLCLLGSAIFLAYCFRVRMDEVAIAIPAMTYLRSFALAGLFFGLPGIVGKRWGAKLAWRGSSELWTGVVVILAALLGLLLAPLSVYLGWLIVPAGLALAGRELYRLVRWRFALDLLASLALFFFLTLQFFQVGYHHPLFLERLIVRQTHIDTLFHSSISSMISTLGWPTTGLDGVPFIAYHWGSHALFGGLRHWVGTDSFTFYNLAYPALFVPLFFWAAAAFARRLAAFKSLPVPSPLFLLAVFALVYSAAPAGFGSMHPLPSESFNTSLTFAFLFGATLLDAGASRSGQGFFWYSVAAVLVITLLKISTGFVCCAALSFLYARTCVRPRQLVRLVLVGVAVAALTYVFVVPEGKGGGALAFEQRFHNLWKYSDGPVTYLLGLWLALIVVVARAQTLRWREWLSSRRHLELEVLAVGAVAGLAGAALMSTNPSDVFYLCTVQFYFSVVFLLVWAHAAFDGFRAPAAAKLAFLLLVTAASSLTQLDLRSARLELRNLRRQLVAIATEEQTFRDFIVESQRLASESRPRRCLFLPEEEAWYHRPQRGSPLASALVTPAISGLPLIGGLTETVMRSTNDYGLAAYRGSWTAPVHELEQARRQAVSIGCEELLLFREVDGRLSQETLRLDSPGLDGYRQIQIDQ